MTSERSEHRVTCLSREKLRECVRDLVEVDRRVVSESGARFSDHTWTETHFESDRPGKWELSAVATDRSGTVLGYWIASRRSESTVHSHRGAVLPDVQGRGVGRDLIALHLELASRTTASRTSLFVVSENQRAIALYRAMGYSVLRGAELAEFGEDQVDESGECLVLHGTPHLVMVNPLKAHSS